MNELKGCLSQRTLEQNLAFARDSPDALYIKERLQSLLRNVWNVDYAEVESYKQKCRVLSADLSAKQKLIDELNVKLEGVRNGDYSYFIDNITPQDTNEMSFASVKSNITLTGFLQSTADRSSPSSALGESSDNTIVNLADIAESKLQALSREIESLKRENAALKAAELTAAVPDVQDNIPTHTSVVDHSYNSDFYEKILQNCDSELISLRKKNNSLLTENAQLKLQIESSFSSGSDVNWKEISTQLITSCNAFEFACHKIQQRISSLESFKDSLLLNTNDSSLGSIETMVKSIDTLKFELAETLKSSEMFVKIIQKLNKRRQEQENELEMAWRKIRSFEKESSGSITVNGEIKRSGEGGEEDNVITAAKMSSLERQVAILTNDLNYVCAQIEKKNEEVNSLQKTLNATVKDHERERTLLSVAMKEKEFLKSHIDAQDADLAKKRQQLDGVISERNELAERLLILERDLRLAESMVQQKSDSNTALSQELSALLEKYERKSQELRENTTALNEMEETMRAKVQEKDLMMATYYKLIDDNEALNSQISGLESKNAILANENSQLQRSIEMNTWSVERQNKLNGVILEQDERIKKYAEKLEANVMQMREQSEEIVLLKEQKNGIEELLKKMEGKCTKLLQDTSTQEAEIEVLKTENHMLKAEVSHISDYKKVKEDVLIKYSELEKKYNDSTGTIRKVMQDLEDERRKHQAELNILNDKLFSMATETGRKAQYENEAMIREMCSHHESEIEALTLQIDSLQQENSTLRESVNALKMSVTEKVESIEGLRKTLDDNRKLLSEKVDSIADLKQTLSEVSKPPVKNVRNATTTPIPLEVEKNAQPTTKSIGTTPFASTTFNTTKSFEPSPSLFKADTPSQNTTFAQLKPIEPSPSLFKHEASSIPQASTSMQHSPAVFNFDQSTSIPFNFDQSMRLGTTALPTQFGSSSSGRGATHPTEGASLAVMKSSEKKSNNTLEPVLEDIGNITEYHDVERISPNMTKYFQSGSPTKPPTEFERRLIHELEMTNRKLEEFKESVLNRSTIAASNSILMDNKDVALSLVEGWKAKTEAMREEISTLRSKATANRLPVEATTTAPSSVTTPARNRGTIQAMEEEILYGLEEENRKLNAMMSELRKNLHFALTQTPSSVSSGSSPESVY